jgi:hypothetical protein
MERLSLFDESGSFDVSVWSAAVPRRAVLFAVGSGGNPERHAPLLEAIASAGGSVVAPHFERLVAPRPTDEQVLLRARRLTLVADVVAGAGSPITGVGHSIGATTLLALAGAHLWMGPGQPLAIPPIDRLDRLALMAPATGFFQAPGALDDVRAAVTVWAGGADTITPVDQAEFLRRTLAPRVPVDLRVDDAAGHFSFMDALPPTITDPMLGRDAFLARLHAEVAAFAGG